MKTTLRSLLCLLLCVLLAGSFSGLAFADEGNVPHRLTLVIGGEEKTVRAMDASYPGNLYLSLTDLAAALNGSEKQFRFTYGHSSSDGDFFNVIPGQSATEPSGVKDSTPETAPVAYLYLWRNRLFVGDSERRYYTTQVDRDLYMSLVDVQLMLDLTMEYEAENRFRLYPDRPYAPDLERLREEGYFDAFTSVLLADADSGDVFFQKNRVAAAPIASLTKLMSYLLIQEALEAGSIHADDLVHISQAAADLARSADGVLPLEVGDMLPFRELLDAMLLASSNEAALALAEHVSGSEDAFVAAMNARAKELQLNSARFYSAHGLPVYTRSATPTKLQNQMSASDMLRLIRYLLEHHPQLTAITARPFGQMPSIPYSTANSNPLVFNMEGVNGLKTGSTNKAGYCLAASLPVTVDGETHTIVLILLGAETADVRGQAAQILMAYAQRKAAQAHVSSAEAA